MGGTCTEKGNRGVWVTSSAAAGLRWGREEAEGQARLGREAAGEEGPWAPALMSLRCPQLTGGLQGEESLRGSAEPASPHTALSMATGRVGGRMCQLAGKRGRCCLQAAG